MSNRRTTLSLDADVQLGDNVTLSQFIAMDPVIQSIPMGKLDEEERTRRKRAQEMIHKIIQMQQTRLPTSIFQKSRAKSDSRLNELRAAWNGIARKFLKHGQESSATLWPICLLDRRDGVFCFEWADSSAERVRSRSKVEPKTNFEYEQKTAQTQNPPIPLRHNLPHELIPCVGRDEVRKEIGEIVVSRPLTTLIGVGGAGKTRLAHQIGFDLLNQFDDGVRRVELVSLVDPRLVPRALADSLEIPGDVSDSGLFDAVTHRLRARKMLLILNNCDHLIEICAQTAEKVLHNCPDIRMLATSRSELDVYGEKLVPIPPLKVPGRNINCSLDELKQYGAIQMFIHRAEGGSKPFALTNDNAQEVVNICRKLEGIPMFIGFAATRVKGGETPEAVWESLRDLFRALRHGSNTAVTKDQTARALIDWSYDPLSDEEKRVFRALSVFRGGWTREAAFAVCASRGLSEHDFQDVHSNLVRKSLVDPLPSADKVERFKLLEPLREYAEEKLRDRSEVKDFRDRHLRYFIMRAKRSEQDIGGPKQQTQLKAMEQELDNLRSAFDFSQNDGDTIDEGLELASSLKWFWTETGRVPEATRRFHDLLGHPAAQRYPTERAKGWIAAVSLHPFFEGLGGPLSPQFRPRIKESLSIAEESGDLQIQAGALDCLGAMAQSELKWNEAKALRERALKLWIRIGSIRGQCNSMLGLMRCVGAMFDTTSVRKLGCECLQLARDAKDDEAIAATLTQLAFEAKNSKRYAQMREYWREKLEVERRRNSHISYFNSLTELTRFYPDDESGAIRQAILDDALPSAESYFEQSLATEIHERSQQSKATALLYLGLCKRFRNDSASAATFFDQAAETWRNHRGDVGIGVILLTTLEFLMANDRVRADQMIQECIDAARSIDDRDALRWSINMRGTLDSKLGQHDSAIKRIGQALEMAREQGHLGTIVFTLYLLANEQIRDNRIDDADLASKEIETLSAAHDDRGWIGTSLLLMGTLELVRNRSSQAREKFLESLKVFVDNGRVHDIHIAVQAIGQCDVLDGKFERAAKIFGAADRPLSVDWRWATNPIFEQFSSKAISSLGEARFNKAYDEGLRMSLSESIQHARDNE